MCLDQAVGAVEGQGSVRLAALDQEPTGAAARDVVERLVNWADQKERELATIAGVSTKGLTPFSTNGTTTEPEMWFPVDLNLAPRGAQSTISIRADGQVVVWFGGMRYPPFDTEVARHELRRALNQMDGVRIPPYQVNGWPRFPLSMLEDPANLLRLVGVLDRLATESRHPTSLEGNAPPADDAAEPILEAPIPAITGA